MKMAWSLGNSAWTTHPVIVSDSNKFRPFEGYDVVEVTISQGHKTGSYADDMMIPLLTHIEISDAG